MLGGHEPLTPLTDPGQWPSFTDVSRRMQYFDSLMYLPDDILTKVDRASMAVSLESRIPLLDPNVIEFSWRLPAHMLYRQGTTKWILRRLLNQYVPNELVDRPKMGFGIPLGEWLRGPLRDWAESHLSVDQLRGSGVFSPGQIRRKWEQHISGAANWQYALWNVLMFQAWQQTTVARQTLRAAA